MQWVELLPDTQTPSWLGLPNNAERVLLTTQGECPTHPVPQATCQPSCHLTAPQGGPEALQPSSVISVVPAWCRAKAAVCADETHIQ